MLYEWLIFLMVQIKKKMQLGQTSMDKMERRPTSQASKKGQICPEVNEDSKKKKEDEDQETPEIWFCQMFRFATCTDYILMVIGSIGAIAVGGSLPAFAFIWGQMTDSFANQGDAMVESSKATMYVFFYLAAGMFVAGTMMYAGWMIAGERQAIACRKAYLKALLKQQIGWFDLLNQTQLASKFAADTISFQNGISQKVGTLFMPIATLISGFIFAFITGWLMTLVIISVLPALALAGAAYMSIISNTEKKKEQSYSKAGGRAEQALSSIKTIKQLNGETYETEKYVECLNQIHSSIYSSSFLAGVGIGSIFLVMFASYALGFWYGSRCVMGTDNCPVETTGERYTAGDVLVVFFSVLMAGFNLTQLGPSMEKIVAGKQAGARIFSVIDREPEIKNAPNAIRLEKIVGKIKFQNVTFSYPKDKTRKVLNGISLEFDVSKSGLVGESGCGKSTILQLIMRFYDPDEGRITLDGHDLRTLELKWLRENIGYVGQQPVLFATSIRENLLFGKEDASEEELIEALKRAEAYDFVFDLEEKMETFVGMGGGQLSGGQRQRIAIARTLLKHPQILLFDEATSALDRRNQRLIQKTLDQISAGHTSITVAHRVRTIMNSDVIHVLEKGKVAESGAFKELRKYKGHQIEEDQPMIQKKKEQKEEDKKEENLLQTKEEKQKKQQEEILKKYEDSILGRIFSYASDKMCLFFFGVLIALANGTIFPIFSLFLSRMLNTLIILYINPNDEGEARQANLYALLFFILGIASFLLTTLQLGFFNIVGEDITLKLRSEVFLKLMKMPIAWFDVPRNNSGTLAARLSTDCSQVNSLATTVIGIMLQNISSLITGIVIGFVFDWRTTLVAIGLMPFLILAGLLEMQYQTGQNDQTSEGYKDSSSLIMEAMMNIRTVSSSGHDYIIVKKYEEKLLIPEELATRKGVVSGLLYGFGQAVTYIIFGLLFYIGAIFVSNHEELETQDMFTAVYAITFAAMSAGNNAHFMPDVAQTNNAAANLFLILDSEDEEQMQAREESKMIKEGVNGDIEFRNISFKYESRTERVFDALSFRVRYGSKVALVGASGCGKSTIIQMLLRYYSPDEGEILINGINLKDFDIHYLRQSFGVVSQEPALFNGSFRQNIKYNLKEADDSQIADAALKANALSFIEGSEKLMGNLNEEEQGESGKGFDRNVGVKGSHISGGQKQRVAIARAILRNPEKLLLDEATSALDSENERKVQTCLDDMMKGKTTISVAHRIETIKNSDKIYVFVKGKILEDGSYSELVQKKGYFYNLERGTEFV